MSSTPRRSGFRLPWSPGEADELTVDPTATTRPAPPAAGVTSIAAGHPLAEKVQPSAPAEKPAPPAASTAGFVKRESTMEVPKRPDVEPQPEFMRELVGAMMSVAEQARDDGVAELRTNVDERVARLHEQAEERAAELRSRADTEIAAIGEWAKAEEQRIATEAESRVSARRQQLDQQLAAAEKRAEREANDVRRRVADFERDLDSFIAQLNEISDPTAFASAAKRMPHPPQITAASAAATEPTAAEPTAAPATDATAAAAAELEATIPAETPFPSGNGISANGPVTEGADDQPASGEGTTATSEAESNASTIVVKGLSSFGAITSFKQSLEGIDGIDGVTLSIGPTGDFVYRATHEAGFDVEGAIRALEGGKATVERQPAGALRVTLTRGG